MYLLPLAIVTSDECHDVPEPPRSGFILRTPTKLSHKLVSANQSDPFPMDDEYRLHMLSFPLLRQTVRPSVLIRTSRNSSQRLNHVACSRDT